MDPDKKNSSKNYKAIDDHYIKGAKVVVGDQLKGIFQHVEQKPLPKEDESRVDNLIEQGDAVEATKIVINKVSDENKGRFARIFSAVWNGGLKDIFTLDIAAIVAGITVGGAAGAAIGISCGGFGGIFGAIIGAIIGGVAVITAPYLKMAIQRFYDFCKKLGEKVDNAMS